MVVSVNPAGLSAGVYSGLISVAAQSSGVAAVLVTYTITSKPTLAVAPPVVVFRTTGNSLPAPQNLQVTSSSRPVAYAVTIQVSSPTSGTWLKVSPSSGQTISTVSVTADPTGLAQGIYNGSVLFTPTESGLNSVAVPVTLVVGCGQGGCILQPLIIAVVNGASFHPTGAPGAIMTIFGANFSDAVYDGSTKYPLTHHSGTNLRLRGRFSGTAVLRESHTNQFPDAEHRPAARRKRRGKQRSAATVPVRPPAHEATLRAASIRAFS